MRAPRSDFFDLCGVRDVSFWPMHRQELSRVAGGDTQAKDLGPALWQASFTTSPALIRDAQAIEAALISLKGSIGSFLAHDIRRPFPKLYPSGDFSDTGEIAEVFPGNAFLLRLGGLTPGFELSPGDYLSFENGDGPSRALHMITGVLGPSMTADALGVTHAFEVFPMVRAGATPGAAVTLKRPSCEMILDPGQEPPRLVDLVASSVTFSGVQIF